VPASDSAAWVTRRVLERVTRFIAALEDEDLEALATGRARLALEYRGTGNRRTASRELDIDAIIQRLQGQDSREAVTALLEQEGFTRTQLTSIARVLQSPIQKQDSVGRVRERIAEAVVGFRLRSDAILGVEPQQKRGPAGPQAD
jgi:hypothetical protein